MSIITISRGSYSRGAEIAGFVAQRLGYQCLDRTVLIEASKEFNIPEVKLIQVLEDPPSFFERFTKMKKYYIAYIQSALVNNLRADNIVYHGLAGHFFVKDIPHVLKVRIIADMEYRIRFVMERDNTSRGNASNFLEKIDTSRKEWGQHLYGLNIEDPIHYDIVINTENLSLEAVVNVICNMANSKQFQTTPASQKKMEDLTSSIKASVS
jgi:cytidylate kinase